MSPAIARFLSLTRLQKRAIQLAIDTILILFSFAAAMALRLETLGFVADRRLWLVMVPVLVLTLAAFVKLGLYRAVIRYITPRALRVVFGGVLLSSALLSLAALALGDAIPATVPLIYAVLLFLSVGGIRFIARSVIMRDQLRAKTPVLIYGAGETGRRLTEILRQGNEYAPLAFVDDDPTLRDSNVAGLRVAAASRLKRLVAETGARTIFLAMPGIGRARLREIIAMLQPLAVEIRNAAELPAIDRARTRRILSRPMAPEDLLGRDPIAPREELMRAQVTGKVVLVSGAGGTIGSELCRQILARGPRTLVLFDVSEYALYRINQELADLQDPASPIRVIPALGSVQNPRRIEALLQSHRVQTVYHAAAYKHVPLVEDNLVEGVRNNVFGTRTLAEISARLGVENFILVSSDKAVRPANVMGATKRLAELICQSLALDSTLTRFAIVRFGNVLGSSGSVIPRFAEQIERGGPVTVTHREMTRYFMTITEAAQLVMQAGALSRGGDVFILDMGEPVKILDLAQTMIRLHGHEPVVIGDGVRPLPGRGEMGIRIIGPRRGDKLFEELLIASDPVGTEHPRILTATEVALDRASLQPHLDALFAACLAHDADAIRRALLGAPIGYRAPAEAGADSALRPPPATEAGRQTVVRLVRPS